MRIPILLALLLVALLPACTPSPSSSDARTLRRGNGGEPDTLDPQRAEDNPSLAILADLYEGLTTETDAGGIAPGAASGWQVSADGLALTFQIRHGLRWSNGDALTASHFAAGLRRAMDPNTAAPNAGLLSAMSGVEVSADDVLIIHLSRPEPALPAILTMPIAAPRHPAAGADALSTPSNGAYRLTRWERNNVIVLERNDRYRDASKVAVEFVHYLPADDVDTELRMYRSNQLDVTSEIPNAQLSWIRAHLPTELHVTPLLAAYGYSVNFKRLGADVAVLTQALAMAVDRERLVAQITGAGEQPAYGWVPPGFPDYQPARYEWHAQALDSRIREAGLALENALRARPSLRQITLCTDASENHRRTALAVGSMWKTALGIELRLKEMEWKVFLATRASPADCDLVRFGWSADFLDAGGFLEPFSSGHPQNSLGYASERFDELMRAARGTVDQHKRMETLHLAEQQLLADGAVIPLFYRVSKRLVKPGVRGHFDNVLGHMPSGRLSLSPAAPHAKKIGG